MKLKHVAVVLLFSGVLFGANDAVRRLHDSAEVISEVMGTPDKAIPQDLFDKAECLVIVPGVKKAAFIVGGKFGRGFISCRHHEAGGWSAPAAVRVEGGSAGFQIGLSETDVIMAVMNRRGAEKLMESKFTVGADASVAAGPVGRTTSADTDALMQAEILTWSRARGVFAGIALNGATLRPDDDTNKDLYGTVTSNRAIVEHGTPPAGAAELLDVLNKYSSHKG
ncbi:MAG: lipid-binding SYLF domain-containing protein [Bryobacteraceae bacterium]|jgi:lipid-binding SYLF domain-containing protein